MARALGGREGWTGARRLGKTSGPAEAAASTSTSTSMGRRLTGISWRAGTGG